LGRILVIKLAVRAAALVLVALLSLSLADRARAARVLVLGAHGKVTARSDRYVPAPGPTDAAAFAKARRARLHGRATSSGPTVLGALQALYRQGQISATTYNTDRATWNQALNAHLIGTPGSELAAVITNIRQIASSGLLTPSRLPEVFLTVGRNVQWWKTGVVPSSGEAVEFSGSQIVWEYYPGQGIELQVLGTFGKADGLYTGNQYPQMLSLVNEMLPLAASRNGALAWEYLFQFEIGQPPWTSAMSQGTAIEALTRASKASTAAGDSASAANYLQVAHQALAILEQPPPEGVAVTASHGTRFLLYSFDPNELVINGFLQTLIGLFDYSHTSGDGEALALFKSGSAEAKFELPSYDTGAWSLYEPGEEDSLDYHHLVTGFLHQLCQKTGAQIYCTEAKRFDSYLTTAPTLAVESTSASGVSFTLSKISEVTITITSGTQTIYSATTRFAYGTGAFAFPTLGPGSYTITLTATDLAGNVGTTSGSLAVS
jgi:hypothetical protein